MPFKSRKQQAFMFARHPKIAKRWAKETDFSDLPEDVERPESVWETLERIAEVADPEEEGR